MKPSNVDRRGIRSSYELVHRPEHGELAKVRSDKSVYQLAMVTEIPVPDEVVVSLVTGTLRAVYARVKP